MRRGKGNDNTKGSDSAGRWATWATILGLPIGILALLFGFLSLQNGDEPAADSQARLEAAVDPADLQSVDLIVHNPAFSSDPQDQPRLEMLLHNAGTSRSVVSRARIEIVRLDKLPICFTQGSLSLSEDYDAQLPASAEPGELVEVPLHQQLGPDRADRFTISLGLVPDEKTEELPSYYLYELRLSLFHDGVPRPLEFGKALVSLPVPPSEAVLTEVGAQSMDSVFNPQHEPVEQYWASQMACWQSNAQLLSSALAGDAARAPELDAVFDEMIPEPTFADLEG